MKTRRKTIVYEQSRGMQMLMTPQVKFAERFLSNEKYHLPQFLHMHSKCDKEYAAKRRT